MRPWLFSHGKTQRERETGPRSWASMGPRLLSRGMSTVYPQSSWCIRCFNEAVASQPRNVPVVDEVEHARELASMRPWLLSHGMTPVGLPCSPVLWCFNEAVAFQPRRGSSGVARRCW